MDLPLLPQAVHEILAATADERCDARRVAELIRRDPALASHVLRIANSPLYLPGVPIVSLQQAISRLGLDAIRRIVLLITCQTRVFQVAGHEADVRAQFRHSLAAGAFAQEIARMRRLNVEEAFLCGLLHDLGRPVLLQGLIDLERELGLPVDPPVRHAAATALHARVGSVLAGRWSLPSWLADTLRHHHAPHEAPNLQSAALVALADDLADLLLRRPALTEEECRRHPLLPVLNLYPDQLDAILRRRQEIVQLIEAIA